MEASQAGVAGGDAQGAEGADGGQEQGPDIGALGQQLEAMQGSQEQMFQFLQQQPWLQQEGQQGAEGEGEPAAEDFDLSFLDADSPQFDPSQVAERLSGLINQGVEQRVQAAMQPVQQQMNEERWNREANALVQEFPDFGDPQKAEEIVGYARQIAEAYGQAELAKEPWFWRMTYMAGRAAESASEEEQGAPEAAHLEGGGGARPGGQQVDLGDQIVNARRGRSALPFG